MRNSRTLLSSIIYLILFFTSMGLSTVSGRTEEGQSKTSADRSLKGSTRINPSTLAMEFSLPLAGYPGRNGNALPVSINYSSKVWSLESFGTWNREVGYNTTLRITDTVPDFSDRASAGWTCSLVPPRLEIKEEYYTSTGKSWSFINALELHQAYFNLANEPENSIPSSCREIDRYTQCQAPINGVEFCTTYVFVYCGTSGYTTFEINNPPSPVATPEQIKFVNRVSLHMPDGSSHEFRKDDTVRPYCTLANSGYCQGGPAPNDKTGTYLSVDNSGMRLQVGGDNEDSILYLPNGSRYTFGTTGDRGFDWYATKFTDVNGNITTFSQTSTETGELRGEVTDTMGRTIEDPLDQNKDVRLEEGSQTINLPGLGENTQDYSLVWGKLADHRENPSDQPLSYKGVDVCFINGGNTDKRHNDGPTYDDPNTPEDDDGPVLFGATEPENRVCSALGGGDRIFNPVVLAEVVLPNDKKYSFKYNQYGEITEITYPTGSREKFEYGKIVSMGRKPSFTYDQTNRGVKKRWIYNSDNSLEQYWEYDASIMEIHIQFPRIPTI